MRAGIGPSLVIDAHQVKLNTAAGIATDFEAGIDYFFLPFLAIGLKGVGTPQYSWPLNVSVDLGIGVGLRAAI